MLTTDKKCSRKNDDVPFTADVVVIVSVVVLDSVVDEGKLIHLRSPEMQVSQDSSIAGQDVKIMHSEVVVSKVNHLQEKVELQS